MLRQRITLLLLVSLLGFSLSGQTPYLVVNSKAVDAIEKLRLPPQDNEALLRAEMGRQGPGIAPRFAQKIAVDVSPATHGNWSYRDGMAIWHLRIPSPGARSLNFGFDQYEMPAGGQLLLFDPAQREVLGPFTPADNEEHAQLWTPIIAGDDIILEVSVPQARQAELQLHMLSVNHDFVGFRELAEARSSGSCNLDVTCGADNGWGIVDQYRDIIQSVAAYSIAGDIFCTGFLVNTVREDCTAYFMTADHCGVESGTAPSLVFYWNYQNSTCRAPNSPSSGAPGNGSLSNFNTGSVYRAGFSPSDFVLLELDDPVPASANAFFAGWDAREELEQDTVISIHHPSGEEKRISFAFNGVYRGAWGQMATSVPDGNHLIVPRWIIGTTEGGSSGGPLFNSDKRVVGQLHGGQASCNNNSFDSFGWLAASWEGGGTPETRLKDWLDPDNTGVKVMDGRVNQACNLFATASPAGQSLCTPDNAAYAVQVSSDFNATVSLSVDGLPSGFGFTFDDTTVAPGGNTQLTVTYPAAVAAGVYIFRLLATDGTSEVDQLLSLRIDAAVPEAPLLFAPADLAADQSTLLTLDWTDGTSVQEYEVELAIDADFNNVSFRNAGLQTSSTALPSLIPLTQYFWRVRGRNTCGWGSWSTTFRFTTGADFCALATADTEGLTIGPNPGPATTSTLEVTLPGLIQEVKLTGLRTDHSYVGDLSATLTSPQGITIQLFNPSICPGVGMLADFADDAPLTVFDFESDCTIGNQAAIEGAFQPVESFSRFNGREAAGVWTLSIEDNAFLDGGDLLGWNLEICTDATFDTGGEAPKIWPNPTSGLVEVLLTDEFSDVIDAAIYDVAGRLVRKERLEPLAGRAQVDLSDLPNGVYLFWLENETGSSVTRVVRQ